MSPDFDVVLADYARDHVELHGVRETVFVHGQQVPTELERDALDPLSVHVLARDSAGRPVGAARLTPARRIGRMAVLAEMRGRGIGEAMLAALVAEARRLHWPLLELHAQVHALAFYARAGFIPHGPRFVEAGIEHRAMQRRLDGLVACEDVEAAASALLGLAATARRALGFYSRALDPGLLDRGDVVDALRRFATGGRDRQIRILLQDADAPQRTRAPLIALAQRLPSVFAFRQVVEPADLAYPSAYAFNDAGGSLFRPLGHRFEGEGGIDAPVPARQLRERFAGPWERAAPCTALRALEL